MFGNDDDGNDEDEEDDDVNGSCFQILFVCVKVYIFKLSIKNYGFQFLC